VRGDPEIGEIVTIAFKNAVADGEESPLTTMEVQVIQYVGECTKTGKQVFFNPEEVMTREDDENRKETS
jgi:hypothetical protein